MSDAIVAAPVTSAPAGAGVGAGVGAGSIRAQPPGGTWTALLGRAHARRSLAIVGGVVLPGTSLYVTATTLPSVVADVGGLALYAWTTTVFVVAMVLGSALVPGVLATAGPRAGYGGATAAFAVGAAVCAGAPSMRVVVVGRAIQGFGGGLLLALSYAMIRRLLPAALWPRALALVSGMWGVGTLLGPAMGGVFAERHAWRWAFGVLVPLAALYALATRRVLPPRATRGPDPVPARAGDGGTDGTALPQLALVAAAVVAASLGSAGRGLHALAAGAAAAALCAGAVAVERRRTTRLLPRGALDPAGALLPRYATLSLLAAAVTSSELFVPLFLQRLHDCSPLTAGYLGALMAVGWTGGSVGASGVGRGWAERLGGVGPGLAAAGMGALGALVPARPSAWVLPAVGASLLVVGLGVGLCWPHLLAGVLAASAPEDRDRASASITTVQLVTGALAAAAAAAVVNAAGLGAEFGDGDASAGVRHAARWLFGMFALGPGAALLVGNRMRRRTALGERP